MSEVKFDEAAFKKWYESSPGAFGYTPVACARWQFEQLKPKIDSIIYENLRCKQDFFVLNEEVKQRNIDIKNKDAEIQQLQSDLKKKDELLDECEKGLQWMASTAIPLKKRNDAEYLRIMIEDVLIPKSDELLQKLKARGK